MTLATRHPIIIWLSLLLLIGQLGCAHGPYTPPPPPSEEVRAQLGTIGVVSARFIPEAEFRTPARGWGAGAGRGAATGAAKGFAVVGALGQGCYGQGCAGIGLLALAAGIVGTVVGGIAGAATAVPTTTVEEAEAALKSALAELKIQEAMWDRVLQVARDHTRHPFVLLTEQGPTAPDEKVNYSSLVDQGIDTILEISVPTISLAGTWDVNPPLALVITVRTRLIQVVDDTALYDSILEYRSGTRKFTEWAVNNAQPFREELDRAYQSLAEKIVEELFLLYLPRESRADHHSGSPSSHTMALRPARG